MPAKKKASSHAHTSKQATASTRPIWSGSISFGLLQIPVTLHGAENRTELRFHQLDKHDLAPIGYKRVNKNTGKEVAWGDIVKGYEYRKGEYVVLSDAEIKAANVKATQTLDIQDFVDVEDIPSTYFEAPYYLAPGKKSAKAYVVLREALAKKNKAAICTFVMHSRQHLCALIVEGDVLLCEVLRFEHELKKPSLDDIPDKKSVGLHPKEMAMAERLVDEMTSKFDPGKYRDVYRDDVLAKVEEKAKTGKVTKSHAPTREKSGKVVDLVSLLQDSIAAHGRRAKATHHARGAA